MILQQTFEQPHLLLFIFCPTYFSSYYVLIFYNFQHLTQHIFGLPRWLSGKESACQCRRQRRCRLDPWVGKIPWRRTWQPTPVFLPEKSQGQRNLMGYSPWGHKESDTTEGMSRHARISKSELHKIICKDINYYHRHNT